MPTPVEKHNLVAKLRRLGRLNKPFKGIFLLLILIVLLLSIYFQTDLIDDGNEYTLREVIDGDTVLIQGIDEAVRYIGINAPEILTEYSPGEPLSEEARNLNKSLVYGKKVRLEFDKEKYDQYGRVLAYIFTDGISVNEELVRNGLARAFIIKPNEKYAGRIFEAERQAKLLRKGIWDNLKGFKPPSENRRFLIKPSRASNYEGERVVVKGKLTDFRKSDKALVLDMEGDLDIVIFPSNWENFRFLGIIPEKSYLGELVEVIGTVKMYKGKPEITISHPISIRSLR